jgi:hypothetical protein
MRDDEQLSLALEVGVTIAGLVSPRVESKQMSLLMRTLHRLRQQARQRLPASNKAPANSRRALLPRILAVAVVAGTA